MRDIDLANEVKVKFLPTLRRPPARSTADRRSYRCRRCNCISTMFSVTGTAVWPLTWRIRTGIPARRRWDRLALSSSRCLPGFGWTYAVPAVYADKLLAAPRLFMCNGSFAPKVTV